VWISLCRGTKLVDRAPWPFLGEAKTRRKRRYTRVKYSMKGFKVKRSKLSATEIHIINRPYSCPYGQGDVMDWCELKWDLRIEGKCNRALREPRWAPLGIKIASHMFMLTLPLSAVAHHCSPASYPRLTLTHLSSPSIANKAALLTFPNRNRFRAGENSG
jgi:hypothetical protein